MTLWLFLPHCRNYLPLGHCEYSSTFMRFSCLATVLPSGQPWFLRKCLPISVLLPSVLGHGACLSCSAWQCHNSKSVYSPSHQVIQGKKRNCPSIICGQILLSSLSVLSLSHGLLLRAVLCTVSFPRYAFMSYVYSVESQSLKILMPKRFHFFGMYCLKITPPFEGNNNFVKSQIFRRILKFGKCAIQNFRQVSYLPSSSWAQQPFLSQGVLQKLLPAVPIPCSIPPISVPQLPGIFCHTIFPS